MKIFSQVSAQGDGNSEQFSTAQFATVHSIDHQRGKRRALESSESATREMLAQLRPLLEAIGAEL